MDIVFIIGIWIHSSYAMVPHLILEILILSLVCIRGKVTPLSAKQEARLLSVLRQPGS